VSGYFQRGRVLLIALVAIVGAISIGAQPQTDWYGAQPRLIWQSPQQARAAVAQLPAAQSTTASIAQKRELRGVPNFGEVSATLYRGGQPSGPGVEELKRLGIEIVVNLRDESGNIENERRQVESLGMTYVSIPWRASDTPDHRQVAQFLALLRANPNKKIFVHCHYGADRTGTMLAAHRIAQHGWTPEQAYAEMRAFNFHRFWHGHLKRYVFAFPETFSTDAAFASLRPAAAQPSRSTP